MSKSSLKILIIGIFLIFQLSAAEQKSIHKKVLDQNMQSMEYIEEDFNSERYGDYLRWALHSQENLREHRKRQASFSMLDRDTVLRKDTASIVLDDPITWRDLTLFCGQKDVTLYLADKLDRTQTALGKATLYGMLAQPIDVIETLKKRQTLIKELEENQALSQEIKNIFTAFKRSENIFLSYYLNHDPFKQIAARRFFMYGSRAINDKLNSSETILNVRNFADHLQRVSYAATCLIAMPLLPLCGVAQLAQYEMPEMMNEAADNLRGSNLPFFGLVSPLIRNKTAIIGGFSLVAGVISALNFKESWEWMTDSFLIDTYIQAKIMHVARVIECLKDIEKVVKRNTTLYNSLEKIKALSDLFAQEELKELFELLEDDTFSTPPSILTNKGKVLRAYKMFVDKKHLFEPAIVALGELDAYSSIATLYTELKKENAPCCFAQYIKGSTPSIELEEFWNPFINSVKAISNSVALGNANRRNMVLTGPNAGGKSTLLKAIAINVIMAQSFGIACARAVKITPFHKIMTYLNITDDIGAGNSLFKAQVMRSQLLLDTIKSLNPDQFSFIIIDEMFNGTSPKEAQACAFSVAKNVAHYNNNITIMATHFALLTQLETETEQFANYHVGVERTRAGGIKYPFKLEYGISDQHVALDILRAEGFDGSIVADAQTILEQNA
jgi:DNA mismatch repair protein MutS